MSLDAETTKYILGMFAIILLVLNTWSWIKTIYTPIIIGYPIIIILYLCLMGFNETVKEFLTASITIILGVAIGLLLILVLQRIEMAKIRKIEKEEEDATNN